MKTSRYYGVSIYNRRTGTKKQIKEMFLAYMVRGWVKVLHKRYPTEREAALAVDLKLIDLNEEPRNILKRK